MAAGPREIVHKDLSYAVVGCAQRVHRSLGPGFPEAVYQKALAHEMGKAGISFRSQAEFEVAYDGSLCGRFRADFCVDGKIILEIKAASALCKQDEAQTLAYLKASRLDLAILMNFGQPSLTVRRFVG